MQAGELDVEVETFGDFHGEDFTRSLKNRCKEDKRLNGQLYLR
jgi:hypothetical protein